MSDALENVHQYYESMVVRHQQICDALETLLNRIELEGATPLDWPAFQNARKLMDEHWQREGQCNTCKHFTQGKNPLVGVYDMECFECTHYYASKWEAKEQT